MSARAILFVLLLVGAIGCGPVALGDRFAQYEAEIARSFDADEAASGEPRSIALPSRRDRILPVGDHRIRALDFLALQGCSLGSLVGERNSPLGRVMEPASRFRYELEVLQVADACVADLSDERAARVRDALAAKRSELPTHRFHAIWNEAPIERYLGAAPVPVLGPPEGDDLRALAALAATLERTPSAPEAGDAVDAAVAALRNELPLGATLRLLADAGEQLDRIAARIESAPLAACDARAARRLRIFEERYLPLQAALAAADRHASQALPALDRIYRASSEALPERSPAMDDYHARVLDPEAEDGLWQRYRRALQRHSAAWEPTLQHCSEALRDAPAPRNA